MTCSKNLGKLLQASCLGLVGMLAGAGCGGSDNTTTTPDAAPTVDGGGGGTTGTVAVNVNPPSADFGSVVKGASSSTPTVITVTNRGVATSLSPSATGPFAITGTTCGTLGAAGTAAGTCTISLSFTPTAVGPASGTLIVTTTGVSVTLTGTGVAPGSFIVTDKVDLGQVLVNAKATGAVTVSATTAVTGLSCALSGADITADATKVCPATLAAGATCTVGFTFQSATAGSKNDAVVCSATGVTQTTTIVADVVTPASLAFQPPATVAVSAPVGSAGSPVSFTLVNSGGAASGALTVTPSGADAAQFVIDNQCVLPLTALNFCKINVTFKPTTAGAKVLTLTVTDANAVATAAPLVATVNGTATPPGSLTLTGAATDFGTVAVGAASAPALVFTLTNPGASDTSTVTVATSDPQFVITSNACNGVPLAAGKTCNVSVVFKPSAAGAANANLSASATGAPSATLPIKGLATGAAALSLAPSTLDFGGIIVNSTSGIQTFTVTNTGQNATGALEVVKADSTSSVGGGSQFNITSTTCAAALAPGATCAVVVTFTPLQTGSASATITVRTVDRTVSSQAGTLLGLGQATAALLLNCAATSFTSGAPGDFGTPGTVVGATGTGVTCTLENTSATASGAITATVTGDFAIATNNCATANLVSNTTCTMALTFTPTAKGPRAGVITVTSANSGTTNEQLAGIGLGIVEITEWAGTECPTPPVAGTGCAIQTQPYDFGQVTVGKQEGATTQLTLAVFVRASVGNLSIQSAFGTPAEFALTQGTCTALTSAAPGAPFSNTVPVCTMVVDFTPQTRAAQTGSVTVTGANGQTDTASMKGTGTGPLTITPSPANFANVPQGTSLTLTLTVTNNGAASISGMSYALAGANASEFVVVSDPLTGSTITAGSNVQLVVNFIPSGTGAANATITVTGSDPNASGTETATVNLLGNGATGETLTATASSSGVFTATPATATSAPLTVTVASAAGAATTGTLTFAFVNGIDFTTTPPSGVLQGTCSQATSNPLAAGGSCTELVWFAPTALATTSRADTLQVMDGSRVVATVALSGTVLPQLTISPAGTVAAPTDLGTTVVNATPTPTTFTVTNNGGANIPAGGLLVSVVNSVNGPNMSGLFATTGTNTCNGVVAKSGGTCTFNLSASGAVSSSVGPYFGQVKVSVGTFSTSDPLQVASSEVKTTVVLPATLGFTPSTNFPSGRNIGTVQVNSTAGSAPITYMLENTGGSNSGAITAVLYNAGLSTALTKANFTVNATACTSLGETGLAPGATCAILVTANPTVQPSPSDAGQLIQADLFVTATNAVYSDGASVSGLRRNISATGSVQNAVYLVDSTTNLAPSNFGISTGAASTSLSATVALINPTASGVTLASSWYNLVTSGLTSTEAVTVGPGATTGCATGIIAAGGTCTALVTWSIGTTASTTPGPRTATVTIGGASITVFGSVGTKPTLSASRTALDFGQVLLAGPSQSETIVVTNTGELPTTAALTATLVPNTGVINTSGCTGSTLASLASCTMTIYVVPQATGSSSSLTPSVQVISTGANPTAQVGLSWTGVVAPAIGSQNAPVDFGNQAVLSTSGAYSSFTFTNGINSQVTGPLTTVAVLDTNGAVVPDFVISGTSSTCVTGKTLDALGGSCTVWVNFVPQSLTPAAKAGTLTVSAGASGGGTATTSLTGTAVSALTATGTVAYGNLSTTGAGMSTTFTWTNAAGAPATGLLTAALTGTNAADFRITNDTCTGKVIAGGASCNVTVLFKPSAVGAETATITVSGSPGNSAALALTGTGT